LAPMISIPLSGIPNLVISSEGFWLVFSQTSSDSTAAIQLARGSMPG
jgi:hypothetical protein